MNINRKDLFWNYTATFFKIAGGVVLLPFILHKLPADEVGIWAVFVSITSFVGLLDFGFNPSFTRNVTYVYSGVNSLKTIGCDQEPDINKINYSLLKGLLHAMRWFYFRMSLVIFVLLLTFGTYYIKNIIIEYEGSHFRIYIAWIILCLISTYNTYTLYYESLLLGKGLVKKSKQIIIIGHVIYLSLTAILILNGFGLIAIVSAQLTSVIITRYLSYKLFFDPVTKNEINSTTAESRTTILKAIYPNAIKVGLTSLGGFLVNKSSVIIGSLFLTLEEIASYGISYQIITLISSFGGIYIFTFLPLIIKHRTNRDIISIKTIYLKGIFMLVFTYLVCGVILVIFGNRILDILDSNTRLLSQFVLVLALLTSFLETNHSLAANVLLTKNEVPFFRASLLSGAFVVIFLFGFLNFTSMGVISLVLAPAIVQALYQNWKWPKEVIKDLSIHSRDISTDLLKVKIK
jgi:O-antigen/teichoic acid export membrane protein